MVAPAVRGWRPGLPAVSGPSDQSVARVNAHFGTFEGTHLPALESDVRPNWPNSESALQDRSHEHTFFGNRPLDDFGSRLVQPKCGQSGRMLLCQTNSFRSSLRCHQSPNGLESGDCDRQQRCARAWPRNGREVFEGGQARLRAVRPLPGLSSVSGRPPAESAHVVGLVEEDSVLGPAELHQP